MRSYPTCNGKSLESPVRALHYSLTQWTSDKLVDPRLDSKHEPQLTDAFRWLASPPISRTHRRTIWKWADRASYHDEMMVNKITLQSTPRNNIQIYAHIYRVSQMPHILFYLRISRPIWSRSLRKFQSIRKVRISARKCKNYCARAWISNKLQFVFYAIPIIFNLRNNCKGIRSNFFSK